jgi:DNA/RNA-binding domain of Phe-tRNA-synthetase-like protein
MKLDPIVKERYPELVTSYAIVRDVVVRKTVAELEDVKRGLIEELKGKYQLEGLRAIPEIMAYRSFFKLIGADPSKQKPPVEYLLRRALTDRFPAINNVVDSCLLATVSHWIIIGAYDLDRIRGEPVVTVETEVEVFELIDGRRVSPVIGDVILRDDEKIISAYSIGDSKACMITPKTKNVLLLSWNAPGIDRSRTEAALGVATDYLSRFCEGKVEEVKTLE